jgi:hypothetical protein
LNDRSCHSATKVKTSSVAATTFLDPPTGMYRYLLHAQPSPLADDAPNDPKVIASMPGPPETECRIVVGHAAYHVLRWIHPVQQSP